MNYELFIIYYVLSYKVHLIVETVALEAVVKKKACSSKLSPVQKAGGGLAHCPFVFHVYIGGLMFSAISEYI